MKLGKKEGRAGVPVPGKLIGEDYALAVLTPLKAKLRRDL
jgi:hypothetical protein